MDVQPIASASGSASGQSTSNGTTQNQALRDVASAVRTLNGLGVEDREFRVVRDPATQRFIVVVMEQGTGTVLDQYPPEDILKMASQLSAGQDKQPSE